MSISFRRATADDADQIAALGLTVWISTYAEDGLPPAFARYVLEQFTGERIRTRIASVATQFWLAEQSDGLVAFAELNLNTASPLLSTGNQAEVRRLYVFEPFTRRGIGRALLGLCRESAIREGAYTLWLSAYSENVRALTFYAREGWTRIGEIPFELEGETYTNFVFATPLPAGKASDLS